MSVEKSLSCFVYYQPFMIYLERSARVKHHLTSKIYSPKQVIPKDPKKTPTLSTECRINMLRKMHMQTLSNSWTRQNPKNLIYFAWEEMPMIEKTSKVKWMNHDRKTQTQTPSPKIPGIQVTWIPVLSFCCISACKPYVRILGNHPRANFWRLIMPLPSNKGLQYCIVWRDHN